MPACVTVEPLDHFLAPEAARIHALQMAAYAQEARLIGAAHFPPLRGTEEAVRSSPARFFGACVGTTLVGAAAVESGEAGACIASLVVSPGWQRRGAGRALLNRLCELYGAGMLQVQTAARNVPALALYRQAGFVEIRRWFVGAESLELVALHRPPGKTHEAGFRPDGRWTAPRRQGQTT